MRVVIQRVKKASVNIDGKRISEIEKGLLVLLGICNEDTLEDIDWLTKKIINLRIFDDENGVMNKSMLETDAEYSALVLKIRWIMRLFTSLQPQSGHQSRRSESEIYIVDLVEFAHYIIAEQQSSYALLFGSRTYVLQVVLQLNAAELTVEQRFGSCHAQFVEGIAFPERAPPTCGEQRKWA